MAIHVQTKGDVSRTRYDSPGPRNPTLQPFQLSSRESVRGIAICGILQRPPHYTDVVALICPLPLRKSEAVRILGRGHTAHQLINHIRSDFLGFNDRFGSIYFGRGLPTGTTPCRYKNQYDKHEQIDSVSAAQVHERAPMAGGSRRLM